MLPRWLKPLGLALLMAVAIGSAVAELVEQRMQRNALEPLACHGGGSLSMVMVTCLSDLRGLRSAPELGESQWGQLRQELQQRLEACDWFTVGVMAPSGSAAEQALRRIEAALGWHALELDPGSAQPQDVAGPAFLKGNQNTGRYLVRPENGLGEGILITGHNLADAAAEDTWGPLPLDVFRTSDG